MFRHKIDFDEFQYRFWVLKDKADKFLITRKGNFLRFSLIGTIIASYPIANMLLSGPLLSTTFRWRYRITSELSSRVMKTIDQQSFLWLEKEGRGTSDTFFAFTRQLDAHHNFDSIRMGNLSSVTGAQIALPFYVHFQTEEEAMDYAKKYLEPFDVLGRPTCVVWESELGRQLLSTFVLSDEALAFLVARDLYSVQQPYLFTQEAVTWLCHVVTYMLCFYALHVFAFKSDAIVFAIALPILVAISIFTAFEWNKFAIYLNEHHSDMKAANLSTKHTQGGQEYYMKFLVRNRILRDLVSGGEKLFTPIGDLKRNIAQYVVRFDGMEIVSSENEQLTLSIAGDDLPENII